MTTPTPHARATIALVQLQAALGDMTWPPTAAGDTHTAADTSAAHVDALARIINLHLATVDQADPFEGAAPRWPADLERQADQAFGGPLAERPTIEEAYWGHAAINAPTDGPTGLVDPLEVLEFAVADAPGLRWAAGVDQAGKLVDPTYPAGGYVTDPTGVDCAELYEGIEP